MKKLASHNTMTYLPVRQWWLKPFGWMSKCQSKSITEQSKFTDYFEFRIRFNSKGCPVFAHGLAEYKYDDRYLEDLCRISEERDGFVPKVMVNLEWTKKKGLDQQEDLFRKFCSELSSNFPDVIFCGGWVKYDWSRVYKFENETPSFVNYTASTTGGKLDDIWPWLFTKFHNKDATKVETSSEYVRVDYIHTAK